METANGVKQAVGIDCQAGERSLPFGASLRLFTEGTLSNLVAEVSIDEDHDEVAGLHASVKGRGKFVPEAGFFLYADAKTQITGNSRNFSFFQNSDLKTPKLRICGVS